MVAVVFISFFLGFLAVIQPGLNRQIAQLWGLSGTILLNSIIIAGLASILFLLVRQFPMVFPEIMRDKVSFTNLLWWYFIPGLCGLALLFGLPWAIQRIGALQVVVIFLSGQVCTSILWDIVVEQIPPTRFRILGALFALIGAALSCLR